MLVKLFVLYVYCNHTDQKVLLCGTCALVPRSCLT
jgi:hypothetical protein